jgi:hypothetical protein
LRHRIIASCTTALHRHDGCKSLNGSLSDFQFRPDTWQWARRLERFYQLASGHIVLEHLRIPESEEEKRKALSEPNMLW